MKKKLLLILLSVAMVVAMMPLSVFAGSENGLVPTKLGETGLYLLGDRAAVEGDHGDYVVEDDDTIVNIFTSGWIIGGQNFDVEVYLYEDESTSSVAITLEDGFQALDVNQEHGTANITIDGDVEVVEGVRSDALTFTGNGTLKILNGYLQAGMGMMNTDALVIDGPTIDVTNPIEGTVGFSTAVIGDLNLKSGKLISTNRNEAMRSLPAVTCMGKIQMGENAEIFANGKEMAIMATDITSLQEQGVCGDVEQKSYDQKETVASKVHISDFSFEKTDMQTFALDDANDTYAKTIRSGEAIEPTTTYSVTFMNDDSVYTTQEVAEGYCAKMPVDPQKDGYKFTGWYLDKEAKEAFDFETPITSNLTLYAGWQKVEPGPGPTPAPDNPSTDGGASTGDNAMPNLLLAVGMGALITGFIAYRKIKSR